jgi:hypothetical protein
MDVMFTHGAGLDGHKKTVMACRVTPRSHRGAGRGHHGAPGIGGEDRRSAGLVRLVGRGGDYAGGDREHRRVLETAVAPLGG